MRATPVPTYVGLKPRNYSPYIMAAIAIVAAFIFWPEIKNLYEQSIKKD